MGDRLSVRDRTLILRVLVPGLETRLRDKMKEVEESEDSSSSSKDNTNNDTNINTSSVTFGSGNSGGGSNSNSNSNSNNKEMLLDLDGVTCEPTSDSCTLWNFHCDGATYPARLVNLPCPVEVHKTHDHAMYYKSCDIAQMLIVYEDSMALDEADKYPKTDGYPSYNHSGITPPLQKFVERRLAFREHQPCPPPRNEVTDVEKELHELMCNISKEGNKGRKPKIPSLATAQHQNKILQEIEEVIVDYEPWMDDYGRQESGIEFNVTDQIASIHPEIWLSPEKIEEIKKEQRKKEEEELKKRQAEREKKQKKKKKKELKQQEKAAKAAAAAANKGPTKKKGIASKKNDVVIDEVTAAASLALGIPADQLIEDEDDLDLGFDMDNLEFDMENM